MGRCWVFVSALAVLLTAQPAVSQAVQFNSVEPKHTYTEASFSVVSGRNASGHWNSKLHFSHTADEGESVEVNETSAWKMDFNQRIEASEDGEKVHLYATVIIPPAGSGSGSPGVSTVSGEARASAGGEGEALQVQGYRPVAGLGYYKFHALPLTWYGALKTCYTEAAQLAVISSEAEAAALRRLFQEHPSVPGAHYDYAAFMGANDLEHEGVYVTVDDVPLLDAGYLRWQDGQPNNYGRGDSPGQDCIAMTRQAEYFDVECYIKLPFICERRLDG